MHDGLERIIAAMEELAPPALAEPWDNVGLVLEGTRAVHKVLLALDVTVEAAHKAAQEGYDALVTHHPPFIAPVKALTMANPNTAALLILAGAGVSLYCAHTNLDFAPGGTAPALCSALGLPFEVWEGQPGGFAAFAGTPAQLGELCAQKLGGQPRVWAAQNTCSRVCLVPGSGGDYAAAALQSGADTLLTGEMKYHDALFYLQQGLNIITVGHDFSERPVVQAMARHLQKACSGVEYYCM